MDYLIPLGTLAVAILALITLSGKIKAWINKDSLKSSDLEKMQHNLENKIIDAAEEAHKYSEDIKKEFKDEIKRLSKWISDNEKEFRDDLSKLNDYLLNKK